MIIVCEGKGNRNREIEESEKRKSEKNEKSENRKFRKRLKRIFEKTNDHLLSTKVG